MFDFQTKLEPECKSKTFRSTEFGFFKERKQEILNFLKDSNSNDKLSLNKNYCNYFIKRYVVGNELWNKMTDFNKSLISVLKTNKYKDAVENIVNDTNSKFDIRNFQFDLDPTNVVLNYFTSYCFKKIDGIEMSDNFLKNDLLKRNYIPDLYFDPDYFCFETQFIQTLIRRYYSNLPVYFDNFSSDLPVINFRINVSNYKDIDQNLHQVLILTISRRAEDTTMAPAIAIVFYYTPENTPTFKTNFEDSNSFYHFENHCVNLTYFHEYSSYSPNDYTYKRIHLYRCNKPIFDEKSQKILRTMYWITYRSKIEHDYNHITTATKKYFLDKYLKTPCENDYSNRFDADYPMFDGDFIRNYNNSVIHTDIQTQWFEQLFFKTINECLYNIENNHCNNSYEQDISYSFKKFNSSRDSLGAIYIRNKTDLAHRLGIIDSIYNSNIVMIIERILMDYFSATK